MDLCPEGVEVGVTTETDGSHVDPGTGSSFPSVPTP